MANRSVIVSFITKLNSRGIKNATKDLKGMDKLTAGIGKSAKLGFAAAGVAAVAFAEKLAKVALKAAIAEEKQVVSLDTALQNLGKGFELPSILAFADDLQRASGVSEDVLRPGLQSLITTTGDVAASQELMKRAIDISKGSGKDLNTVILALNRAFSGNLASLGRLNVGLDKNLLKSGDVSAVMDQLASKFSGQGAKAAATMAGSLDRMKVSASEAAETLGKGIFSAVEILGTDSGTVVESFGKKLEDLAGTTSSVLAGLAGVGRDVSTFFGILNEQSGGILAKTGEIVEKFSVLNRLKDYLVKRGEEELTQLERTKALTSGREESQSLALNKGKVEAQRKYLAAVKATDPLVKAAAAAEAKAKAASAAKAAEKKRSAAEEAARQREADRQAKLTSDLAAKFDIEGINLSIAARRANTQEEKAAVAGLQALRTEGYKDDETALNKLMTLDKMRADRVKQETSDLSKLSVSIPVDFVTRTGVEIPMGGGGGGAPAASSTRFGTRGGITAPTGLLEIGNPMTLNPELRMVDRGAGAEAIQVFVDVQGNVFTEQELTQAIASGLYELQRSGQNTTLTNLGR